MPQIRDNAVVIRRWDFSETSQTVSLLTREHGVIRGLAKGSKREKGAFSGGLDVLTRGEICAIVKPSAELANLTAWNLQETFRVLRESLAANRAGLYMADLVHHLLIDHDPHPRVFDALVSALTALNDPTQVELALLRMQWILLCEAGYRPQLSGNSSPSSADAAWLSFSAQAGGIVSSASGEAPGAWRVRRQTVEVLECLAQRKEPAPSDFESVRRANRLLAAYLREVIGKELITMRGVFPDLHI